MNWHQKELLRISEAAEILSVSPKTIRRMIEDGDINATSVRGALRVTRYSLERYLEEQEFHRR